MEERIKKLEEEILAIKSSATIPYEVDSAFRDRMQLDQYLTTTQLYTLLPTDLFTAPLTAITSPTGGATIDTQARTAIDDIITRLEDLGLVDPN